jgi:acetylornithine/succinyldiaminopimelate/putrescine aminotransferase
LLILDEVQTGVGRTGQFLAAHGAKIRADITTLAKGLAAGLPLGAMLAREEVAQVMIPGTHASTFGGNPFSCAAAQVVVEHVGKEDFLAQVRARGALARRLLEGVCQRVPGCVEVRGQGLLLGLELAKQAEGFVDKARQNGVLANVIGDRVLRVAPPLVITDAELTEGIQALEKTLFETTSK